MIMLYTKINLIFFLIAFCLATIDYNAQTVETKALNNKKYKVYTSLSEALKVNPDSVEGLVLCSYEFKDFPTEILKFKKLKYLNIWTYSWEDFKDPLLVKEIAKYDSIRQKNRGIIENKPDYINSIPKGIKKLKDLEIVDFSGAQVSDKAKKRMLKYLPENTERYPDYRILKKMKELEK